MAQKNPFLKYLIKDKKEDFFHTSGYAKAQSGANMGAASTESYQVRVNVNQNRRVVSGYKDSEIMKGTRNKDIKAKAYTPPAQEAGNRMNAAGSRPPMPVKNPGISLKK